MLGGPLQKIVIRLETGAGVVPVELEREGADDRLRLDGAADPDVGAVRARGRAARRCSASSAPGCRSSSTTSGRRHVYVELGSPEEVAALAPDFARARAADDARASTASPATAAAGRRACSCPAHGVAEDPATGSAAGPLAVHLARHGRIAFGEEIEIDQGVEIGRPSTLFARVDGSAERIERVLVGGSAVIVARGEFKIP